MNIKKKKFKKLTGATAVALLVGACNNPAGVEEQTQQPAIPLPEIENVQQPAQEIAQERTQVADSGLPNLPENWDEYKPWKEVYLVWLETYMSMEPPVPLGWRTVYTPGGTITSNPLQWTSGYVKISENRGRQVMASQRTCNGGTIIRGPVANDASEGFFFQDQTMGEHGCRDVGSTSIRENPREIPEM